MKRIGFDANDINERGTSVALFDYACGVKEILGYEAVVFYSPAASNPQVVEKFRAAGLELVPFERREDLAQISSSHDLDFCYYISSGTRHDLPIKAKRSGVHAVFRHYEPHGDVYAYVSSWLADWMTGGQAPAVPHIVNLPAPQGTMREELGIPEAAFVVGRYGGFDQFNLPAAKRAVSEALSARKDLYCVFVNTEQFVDHPRALFLPPIVTMAEKVRFIASCDVGLNAKKIGESFGLATAEFMMLGKPVFNWRGGMDQNHTVMTPKPDWCYRTRKELFELLVSYKPDPRDQKLAFEAVQQYRPEPVMKCFDDVFLSGKYRAEDLNVGPAFHFSRRVQKKFRQAKFRIWKTL